MILEILLISIGISIFAPLCLAGSIMLEDRKEDNDETD